MIHSFSGPADYAAEVVAMGLAVSFSGLVFRRGEEASAEAVALVPADRLLVETDSPFLSPPGAPRGRNQPEFVAITARWAAERRGVGEDGLDAFGDGLVAAYDATFPRAFPWGTDPGAGLRGRHGQSCAVRRRGRWPARGRRSAEPQPQAISNVATSGRPGRAIGGSPSRPPLRPSGSPVTGSMHTPSGCAV